MTGANSFLGIRTYRRSPAVEATEVACLVRENPGQSATARFTEALREYRLEHLDLSRVHVCTRPTCANPAWGCKHRFMSTSPASMGCWYSAAHVNHVMDYASLAQDNVEPVLECLRLCETHLRKESAQFRVHVSASSSVGP